MPKRHEGSTPSLPIFIFKCVSMWHWKGEIFDFDAISEDSLCPHFLEFLIIKKIIIPGSENSTWFLMSILISYIGILKIN